MQGGVCCCNFDPVAPRKKLPFAGANADASHTSQQAASSTKMPKIVTDCIVCYLEKETAQKYDDRRKTYSAKFQKEKRISFARSVRNSQCAQQ